MEKIWWHNIVERIQNDQELVAEFTSNMQLITKQTWVKLTIDTSCEWVAWMKPGETKVFFNPVYTLKLIQAIQQQRAKEFWIVENFTFDINHLSQIILHEINHMINRANLKMSNKKVNIKGKKMNMTEYENFLHTKYGQDFHDFENMLEDIDVNNHATMIQAPVLDTAKQDIYHHITIPSNDFSQYTLANQFGRAILRESMLPNEKCIVDPRVRVCIDYLSKPGESLEKLRNPSLKFDEQLPIIHRLYEEYYLRFKQEDEKNQQKNRQENQQQNWEQQNWQENQQENQSNSRESDKNWENTNWKNENNENQENTNWNPSQKSGILWKLKDRIQKALNGEKWESKQSNDENDKKQNSSPTAQNDGNTPNKQKNGQKKQPYTPWKPMLLPHIFENLDEEWNNLLEQIEQSLKWWKEKSEHSKEQDSSDSVQEWQKNTNKSEKICDAIEQAIQEAMQQQMEDQKKSPEERSLEAMIEQEWDIDWNNKSEMRNIKNAIKRQTQLKEQIKKIKDAKWQSVYDKITKEIFSKIVQLRKRNKISERHARPFSEWWQLDPQNLVNGIMDWKAWDDDPRILQQEYKEQKEKMKAGWFSITFILDGSCSMDWEKNKQQALSTLLMLYSLQQLNQDIKLEWWDMEDFLISTQAMMFCGSWQVKLLKGRWKELNMKDMIEITNELWYCDWWDTNAWDAINLYYKQVSKPFERISQKQYDERKQKVKDWKFKEIVFVLSDWEFNSWWDPTRTIQKLREMWIIVCGIWITDEWSRIIDYFGKKSDNDEKNKEWFGIVCKNASDLWNTLNELLIQHLEDPSIVG